MNLKNTITAKKVLIILSILLLLTMIILSAIIISNNNKAEETATNYTAQELAHYIPLSQKFRNCGFVSFEDVYASIDNGLTDILVQLSGGVNISMSNGKIITYPFSARLRINAITGEVDYFNYLEINNERIN